MNRLLDYSISIKKEANQLLKKYQVIDILKKYGEVEFTGSYKLNLMYKKDIDISLINDDISIEDFSSLGKELIDKFNTPTAYYRNTNITPVEKRPENALYWGIKTDEWFLDIWAMSREIYSRADLYIKGVKALLNDSNKIEILRLKEELLKNKTYGKFFGSRELYDAVLNHNVISSKEFNLYLDKFSNLNEYK